MWRYRLSFLLPVGFSPGPFAPVRATRVACHPPLVRIDGPSRELVFVCTAAFLRAQRDRWPDTGGHIAAVLRCHEGARGRPASDSYQIIIGADVAFAATGIEPTLFRYRQAS